ncbi:hypothetical protein ACWGBH_34765 [Streptomyces massasporeus]
MVISSEQMQNAALLWEEHLRADFPADLRGVELGGIDMVLLDAQTAGCAHTWIGNGGVLNVERTRTLLGCIEDLDRVTPQITTPSGRQYYERLHRLALLISTTAPEAR